MNINKDICIKLIATTVMLLISSTGFAEQFTQLNSSMSMIQDTLLGGTGMALATIAVAATGVACVFGRCEFTTLMYVVAGVAIIFGSSGIVRLIQGAVGGSGGFF